MRQTAVLLILLAITFPLAAFPQQPAPEFAIPPRPLRIIKDEFKKATQIWAAEIPLWPGAKSQMLVVLARDRARMTSAQRLEFGESTDVTAAIAAVSDDWRFLKCHDLNFLIDKRAWQPATNHEGDVGRGYVTEHIRFNIPFDKLAEMARAEQVRGRLCNSEFSFSSSEIAGLREFMKAAEIDENAGLNGD